MSELSDDCFHSGHSQCRHSDCSCSCHRAERLAEENQALRSSNARLKEALAKETADHKPSVATGLPCKCFLCKALTDSQVKQRGKEESK